LCDFWWFKSKERQWAYVYVCWKETERERDREKERAREYIEYHFSCFSITLPLAIWGDTANNK